MGSDLRLEKIAAAIGRHYAGELAATIQDGKLIVEVEGKHEEELKKS